MSLVDLITLTALLGITAPVKEAALAVARGDSRGTARDFGSDLLTLRERHVTPIRIGFDRRVSCCTEI